MTGILRKRLPPEAWETLAALLLLALRAWFYPVSGLWRDWFAILCAFWIFTAASSRTRAWSWGAGAVMAGLLILYASTQIPLTLTALGFGS